MKNLIAQSIKTVLRMIQMLRVDIFQTILDSSSKEKLSIPIQIITFLAAIKNTRLILTVPYLVSAMNNMNSVDFTQHSKVSVKMGLKGFSILQKMRS